MLKAVDDERPEETGHYVTRISDLPANNDLREILSAAVRRASNSGHAVVTFEHVLLAVIDGPDGERDATSATDWLMWNTDMRVLREQLIQRLAYK